MISQAYPWSGLTHGMTRELVGRLSPREAAHVIGEKLTSGRREGRGSDGQVLPLVLDALEALAWWLRSKKRLVGVSYAAQEILVDVSEMRQRAGYTAVRWNDLPVPGSALYDRPLMLHFEGEDKHKIPGFYAFIQSVGDLFAPRLRFLLWWRSKSYEKTVQDDVAVWIPYFEEGCDVPFLVTQDWWESFWSEGRKISAASLAFIMAANTLAALNTEHEVPLLRQQREGDRKRICGGVRGVSSYDLDISGLFVWKKKYIDQWNKERENGDEHEARPHGPPTLHHVEEHEVTYWVLSEHLRPGEVTFGTKVGTSGATLYAVRRQRAAHARGGLGVRPEESRIRVGPDDIDTKRS